MYAAWRASAAAGVPGGAGIDCCSKAMIRDRIARPSTILRGLRWQGGRSHVQARLPCIRDRLWAHAFTLGLDGMAVVSVGSRQHEAVLS